MHKTLSKISSAGLLDEETVLLGLVLVVHQVDEERHGDNREDNRKAAISPSPVGLVETLRSLGSSKGSDHVRRGSKGESQTSVSQGRSIGSDNIHTVDESAETDVIEDLFLLSIDAHQICSRGRSYLCGTVGHDIVACGREDQTHNSHAGHDQESDRSAPNIESFGDRQIRGTGHDI